MFFGGGVHIVMSVGRGRFLENVRYAGCRFSLLPPTEHTT